MRWKKEACKKQKGSVSLAASHPSMPARSLVLTQNRVTQHLGSRGTSIFKHQHHSTHHFTHSALTIINLKQVPYLFLCCLWPCDPAPWLGLLVTALPSMYGLSGCLHVMQVPRHKENSKFPCRVAVLKWSAQVQTYLMKTDSKKNFSSNFAEVWQDSNQLTSVVL